MTKPGGTKTSKSGRPIRKPEKYKTTSEEDGKNGTEKIKFHGDLLSSDSSDSEESGKSVSGDEKPSGGSSSGNSSI